MKTMQAVFFALLLILPALALQRLGDVWDGWLVVGYVAVLTLLAYLACALDKRKAKRGAWRTPESTLHLLELFGGWAGSFVAQRMHRHKISKTSYQVVFWLIVFLYQVLAAAVVFRPSVFPLPPGT